MALFDIDKARRETPGCETVLHFNNAGAALMPTPVINTISNYLQLEIMKGGYEAADIEQKNINRFYDAAASLIGAKPTEIGFSENATRAWQMVFYAIQFNPGDRILTSQSEYASNYLAFLQIARKVGVRIEVVKNDQDGQISLKELENLIDHQVKLIAITHIPAQGGLINPVAEIGRIAKRAGIFYLLDATQSIGQMPVHVKEIGCDALCATGRKFLRGPRGTGFLYASAEMMDRLEPPFIDLHAARWKAINEYQFLDDARRFETWETSCMNKLGLTQAIEYAMSWGIEETWERIISLSNYFRHRLSSINGVILEDIGKEKCGIVTFIAKKLDAKALCLELRKRKINVAFFSKEKTRLDFEPRGISSLLRTSLHYYNTEEEIERFCSELEKILI